MNEKFINSLKGKPTFQGLEEAEREKLEKAMIESHKTEADFLKEMEKVEQEKRESIEQLAEEIPKFLSQIDECVINYHAEHRKEKKQQANFIKYDALLAEVRNAVEIFLSNIAGKEFVELLEHDIVTISDLCKQIYAIDDNFPNLELFDRSRFIEAAKKEVGIKSGEITAHFLGRFTIVGNTPDRGYGVGGYYFFDQQASRISNRIALSVEAKNNIAIIQYETGVLGDLQRCLFNGENGEFSKNFRLLFWGIGDLVIGRDEEDQYTDKYLVFDKNGNIIWQNIDVYIPNETKTKALIRENNRYNILLSNGELMFGKDCNAERVDEDNLYPGFHMATDKIYNDFCLKYGDKYFRLNKDLEVVAEGFSQKEVKKREGKKEEVDENAA